MTDPAGASAAEAADSGHLEWSPSSGLHLAFNLVLMAISVGYLALALQLPQRNEAGPDAGFFPVVAVSLFLVCMAIDTARLLIRRAGGHAAAQVGRFSWKVVVVLGTILGYLVLVQILGHLLTAMLLTATLLRLLGKRPWWQIAVAAVLAAVGSDFLFTQLLGLRLTAGLTGIGFAAWI